MKRSRKMWSLGVFAWVLGGCGSPAQEPTVDGGAPTVFPTLPPCPFKLDHFEPVTVLVGQAQNTLVVAKGCGFLTVHDVQVDVVSVPFRALDDTTLVFAASRNPIEPGPVPLGEVDILRTPPEQVQGFLKYEAGP